MEPWYHVATAVIDSLAMLFLVFQLLGICKVKQAVLKQWAMAYQLYSTKSSNALNSRGPESLATPNTAVSSISAPKSTRMFAYLAYTRFIQCLAFPLSAFSSFTLQRKLRFMAVFSCLLAKITSFIGYLAVFGVGDTELYLVSYLFTACLYSLFLFSTLTLAVLAGVDRYIRVNLIVIGTASYSHWQWLRNSFVAYTGVVIISNFFNIIPNSIASTDGFRLTFLVLNVLYLLSCISLDTYINVKMVRTAIIVNLNVTAQFKSSPQLLELQRSYIGQLRWTLYLYLLATIVMDIVAICIYFIGETVMGAYSYEFNHLAASWIAIRIYIFFKYLNAVFNATRRSRKKSVTPYRIQLLPSNISQSLNTVQSYNKKFGGGGNRKSPPDDITGRGAILDSNLQASQEYSYRPASWNSQSFSVNSAVPGSSIRGTSQINGQYGGGDVPHTLDAQSNEETGERDFMAELSRIHEDQDE